MRDRIEDKWVRVIDRGQKENELTFCGVLEEVYPYLSAKWNSDTQKRYDRYYNGVILPSLDNHNDKIIEEYEADDYKLAIEKIIKKGYERNSIRNDYDQKTIAVFRYLIYVVVLRGSQLGLCSNVLWDTEFAVDVEEIKTDILAIIKKSFTPKEESILVKEVMKNPNQSGDKMGLALMEGLGVRDGEAAGLNYGCIMPLEKYPDIYIAKIFQSTIIESNEVQLGGKTVNMGRVIPVPDKLLDLILKRKETILKIHEELGIMVDIDDYPIANTSPIDPIYVNSFFVRCKARHINNAAKEVFKKMGITSNQLAVLDRVINEKNLRVMVKEKNATAYVFRRNFATHLQIIPGLTMEDRQYLMGHELEDTLSIRNDFLDEDRIKRLHDLLVVRPLINNHSSTKCTVKSGDQIELVDGSVIVKLTSGNSIIKIIAKEPGDQLIVKTGLNNKKHISYKKKKAGDINVSKEYIEFYEGIKNE